MTSEPIKLVICGGGNGAQAWSGIASSQPNTEVRVLTLFQDEAQRWSDALQKGDFTVSIFKDEKVYAQLKTKPKFVTKQPEEAIPGCDIIAFVMPAFAHEQYLNAIKPYIEPGVILVGLPGQAGFEFQVYGILGDVARQCSVMNFETLPWATRITDFGRAVDVLGTKESLVTSHRLGSRPPKRDLGSTLQILFGEKPRVIFKGDLIASTLTSPNHVHPCILHDRWASWDGTPLDHKPPFYHGITEKCAEMLTILGQEKFAVIQAIKAQRPQANLEVSSMVDLFEWFKINYANDIKNKSSLYTVITTNQAYNGLTHPMVQTDDGKWVPNFNYRYLTEDIPYGLVVQRGIAEIVDVPTPNLDMILLWAQHVLKKEYLVDGKIQGKDVKETRAPQRYGFTTLKDLLGE